MMPIALEVLHLRLNFTCQSAVRFNPFSASAWRGCLGHHLKKAVCTVRGQSSCQTCILRHVCVYTQVFDVMSKMGTQKTRLPQAIPVPYVIRPQHPQKLQKGDACHVHMLLFGHAHKHLPFIIHALGHQSLDIGHGQVKLHHVDVEYPTASGQWQACYADGQLMAVQASAGVVPPVPTTLRIELCSALRLRKENHLLRPESLHFRDFMSFLLRRISLLYAHYSDTSLDIDHKALLAKAEQVEMQQKDLHWHEGERYSSRQKTRMKTGGLLGSFHVSGIEEFWPYLWYGQWLHVGKNTSMGQGAYVIHLG